MGRPLMRAVLTNADQARTEIQPLSLADISNWDAAVRVYKQALAQEVAYDAAFWRPAYRLSQDGGANIPADVDAAMERLQEHRLGFQDQMIDVPAPALEDLQYKIEILRDRWEGFEWSEEVWAPIDSDLSRLAAEFKKVVATIAEVPRDTPESPVAKYVRLQRSREWRAAVDRLNNENLSGDNSDEAFDRAGDAFTHAMSRRVTTLDEFREKLTVMSSNASFTEAYLDELFRDLDALGAPARREMAA
jgi:hypothetical protein